MSDDLDAALRAADVSKDFREAVRAAQGEKPTCPGLVIAHHDGRWTCALALDGACLASDRRDLHGERQTPCQLVITGDRCDICGWSDI
jgi:ribosomal protein S27AE